MQPGHGGHRVQPSGQAALLGEHRYAGQTGVVRQTGHVGSGGDSPEVEVTHLRGQPQISQVQCAPHAEGQELQTAQFAQDFQTSDRRSTQQYEESQVRMGPQDGEVRFAP